MRQAKLSERLQSSWSFARFAFRTLIAPWPPYAVFLVVIAGVGGVIPLVHIYATRELIDLLMARDGSAGELDLLTPYAPWLGLLIGMMVLHYLAYYDTFQRYLVAHLNERVMERFGEAFFARVFALPLEQFEHPEFHDTMTRAYRAVNGAHPKGRAQMAAEELYMVQRLISCTVGAATILWALSKVHFGIVGLLLVGGVYMMRWSIVHERLFIEIHYDQTVLQRQKDYWGRLLTDRASAAEVRVFGLGPYMLSAWQTLSDQMINEVAEARWAFVRTVLILLVVLASLYGFSIALLLYVASTGALSVGQVVAMLYAVVHYLFFLHNNGHRITRVQWFLSQLRYAYDFFGGDGGSRAGIAEGRRTTPDTAPGAEGRRSPPVHNPGKDGVPEIVFEGVGFTYPGGNRPALLGIDLRIRPGERVALLGENGSGKTTLVKLMLGLYRPTEGRIWVDGEPLDGMDLRDWRARVGAVFQDYGRYAFTVRENVGFGRLEKLEDGEAIRQACLLSAADEMVAALPGGYETVLGREFEGGTDLSRGQWQALAIARAYLRDAEILALDEPTSALDALGELAVYRQFADLSAGKTVLLISHRLGSARLADRIVFLQAGCVAEMGTHEELIRKNGSYAALYAMQAAWYGEAFEEVG